jgi:shikimate kinase
VRLSELRKIQNIALIGFMGTGKSAVGRLLAEALHFRFIDTDELIEQHTGKTVSRLFEEDGETVFRDWEWLVVEDLKKLKRAVIATGGGVGANEKNLASLKQHALVVCLWAAPQIIWSRVGTQTHRPLLQTANPQEKIRELLKVREPFYRQADVLVNTEVRSAKEVAQHVAHEFHFATRPR